MDGSKIKSFVICLLAAVNLIFLSLVIADSSKAARLQRQIREDLSAILLENGVELTSELLPETGSTTLYPLSRDLEAEAALAEAVLGPVQGSDQGGNIYYYENQAGWARFRGNGEFEIVLTTPLDKQGRTEMEAARRLLKAMDAQVLPEPSQSTEADLVRLRYLCALDTLPVYDCYIELCFSQDGLISISGRRPIGPANRAGASVELNPATALLTLLSHTRDSGHVFSQVKHLEWGYSMAVSAAGTAELVPVWSVETDAGAFYVNAHSLTVELGLS